jgi:hypothetical protein
MGMNENKNQKEQDPDSPYEAYRIASGQILVWRPARPITDRIPCVTIGSFKSGLPCINFRLHKLVAPGVLEAMHDGIALTFNEFDVVFERLRRIAEGTPDAAA